MNRLSRFNHIVAMVCIYAIVFTLAAPGTALAKGPKPLGWDNVLTLRKGDTIHVTLFSKQVQTGKVDRVEPTGIALTTKEGSLLIPRENIKSVAYVGKPKVANPGLWMAAGGVALTGAAMLGGTAKDISDINSGKLSGSTGNHGNGLAIAGLGIAAGGIAVFFIGGKPKLIYEARTVPPTPTKD
jgi:hypothetical protein